MRVDNSRAAAENRTPPFQESHKAMSNEFQVRVLGFSNIMEIEGTRTSADYAALLEATEYGDISGMDDAELREMCLMSLQDLKPAEAAYLVLKHDMSDVLRDGQMRNIATEMPDEKLWEEYVDPSLHERLFNAGSLLYRAFPQSFPKPDAVRVELEVTAANPGARAQLARPLEESFLVRLLADGMDRTSVIHRMYGEQLDGKSFPGADQVAWIVNSTPVREDVVVLEVIGSGYWLDDLEHTRAFQSDAYSDANRPAHR